MRAMALLLSPGLLFGGLGGNAGVVSGYEEGAWTPPAAPKDFLAAKTGEHAHHPSLSP